jgi:hypothetical protein
LHRLAISDPSPSGFAGLWSHVFAVDGKVCLGINLSQPASNLLAGGGLLFILVAMFAVWIAVWIGQRWQRKYPVT